ncbi:MAG: cyclic nucleotide-binding/CBS domain-containing protein, partial [Nitrososphaerales archaeon]
VKDVMNSPVMTAPPDASVKELANKMSEANVGSMLIMGDDGKPLGIVSDWDIVSRAAVRDELPSSIRARDIMQPLIAIESEESVTNAARLLRKHGIKRLGVTYKKRLVGVLSASDVIAVMPELVDVISEKAGLMRGEMGRSPTLISGYCDGCNGWSDLLQYTDGKFLCEECRGEGRPAEVSTESR